ncbi:MAG TPA: glycoside hydrolase family 36 N-terminal domain-containing protein [Propionibacteriaceae bacterium]|jgi:alpha-galactosidase|nr:glycoside hydrolase family 36 N-terminal domain-containing protein [Propionibacteriaceae bacterium]
MSVEDAEATVFPVEHDAVASLLHMRVQGVSLLLQLKPTGLPVILHWGADLGDLDGLSADALLAAFGPTGLDPLPSMMSSLVPELSAGWSSRAALAGSHDGYTSAASFTRSQARLISDTPVLPGLTEVGADTVIIEAEDRVNRLSLDLAIQLTDNGLVRCRAGVTNKNVADYRLEALELFLPVSDLATHRIEFDGPALSTAALRSGSWSVDHVGFDDRPAQLALAEAGTGFRRGQVWQVHVAFSGAVQHRVERTAYGRTYLGGGEFLQAGEIVLGIGEAYHSPWVVWAWGDGLDAAAARLHRHLQQEAPRDNRIIFDAGAPAFAHHDRQAMLSLAEYAAAVGAETFLLDIGWCSRAGLDPYADSAGLTDTGSSADLDGLLTRIRNFDLEVGFVIELELFEADPATARDHPDWLLTVERDGVRRQVLDLSVRPAMVHVWERLTKLLDRHHVSLLSWSPPQGAHRPGATPAQHKSTLAAYRLLDALRERYPQLTIQTTSLDLAMATRAVGADLSGDSTARHADFAGLVQLLPPGLVWQPALDEPDDATSSAYRAISTFFGRLGLGIDLRKQAPGNLRAIHRWLGLYKKFRALLHSGTTVRSDESDRGFLAHGVVAADRDEALFALVWLERTLVSRRIRIDGLDPATSYRIEVIGARPGEAQTVTPSWASGAPVLTGQALGAAGIPLPPARRGSALLLHLQSVA